MEAHDLRQDDMSERLALYGLDSQSQQDLRDLKPLLEGAIAPALETFYTKLRADPEMRSFFKDDSHMDRIRDKQADHWAKIAEGDFDSRFLDGVRRVGHAHARIGLEPRLYISGYATVLPELMVSVLNSAPRRSKSILSKGKRSTEITGKVASLIKAAMMDLELSVSVYLDQLKEERRQTQATLDKSIENLTLKLEAFGNGDLTVSFTTDELAGDTRRIHALNTALGKVGSFVRETQEAVADIRSGSGEIAHATEDLARRTEQQAASLEQTTGSITSLTESVQDTAASARKTNETVDRALRDTQAGNEVVRETQSAMAKIEASSSEMSQIISVIDEIAFQTNLLALNAGVEAARAGEAGKGFAVVAVEVRTLAQRSAEAARSIKSLIEASSQHVAVGADLVKKSSDVLGRSIGAFEDVSEKVNLIAAETDTQATSIAEISTSVSYLDQMTQQNAAMVEQSSAAANSLSNLADNLGSVVAEFRVSP